MGLKGIRADDHPLSYLCVRLIRRGVGGWHLLRINTFWVVRRAWWGGAGSIFRLGHKSVTSACCRCFTASRGSFAEIEMRQKVLTSIANRPPWQEQRRRSMPPTRWSLVADDPTASSRCCAQPSAPLRAAHWCRRCLSSPFCGQGCAFVYLPRQAVLSARRSR